MIARDGVHEVLVREKAVHALLCDSCIGVGLPGFLLVLEIGLQRLDLLLDFLGRFIAEGCELALNVGKRRFERVAFLLQLGVLDNRLVVLVELLVECRAFVLRNGDAELGEQGVDVFHGKSS